MDCLAYLPNSQKYSLHFTQNISLRTAHAAVLYFEAQHLKEGKGNCVDQKTQIGLFSNSRMIEVEGLKCFGLQNKV